MNFNYLRYFSVLARTEHYGKAAEELGISQPSLSNAISRLEEELGVYLFEKQGRNVRLTYYGKRYRELVDQGLFYLQQGQSLMTHFADQDLGIIRIGAVSSAGPDRLLPILGRYSQAHPKVQFSYMDGTSLTLLDELKEEKYDLVISARETADPDLSFFPLWEQRFMAILPPRHPLASHSSLTLNEISRYPLIRYHESAAARKIVDELFNKAGLAQITRASVSDDYHIAGMVAAGLGLALMVDSPMPDLYGLIKLPLADVSVSRKLYLVTAKNAYISNSAQDLIHLIKECFPPENFSNCKP